MAAIPLFRALQEQYEQVSQGFRAGVGPAAPKELDRQALAAEAAMAEWCLMDDRELLAACQRIRSGFRQSYTLRNADYPQVRAQALACIAATCERQTGLTLTHEQMFSVLAMHEGYAVDLRSGAGKSVAVACCAVLQVWSHGRVHVISASEALAERDAGSFKALFAMSGCSVGWIAADTPPDALPQVYACQVVYATGRQILSDYVRDRILVGHAGDLLRRQIWSLAQAGDSPRPMVGQLPVALVDDIDRVLLDEALSPLVISAAGDYSLLDEAALAACRQLDRFSPGTDYRINAAGPADVVFTESGLRLLDDIKPSLPAFWREPRRCEEIVIAAIIARDMLEAGKHYTVHDGRLVPFADRLQAVLGARSWYHGMMQAVEARESLSISAPPRTVTRATMQEFFPQYQRLSGIGSALADLQSELHEVYDLRVIRPLAGAGQDLPMPTHHSFPRRDAKLDAVVHMVTGYAAQGDAVLVMASYAADMESIASGVKAGGCDISVAIGLNPNDDRLALAHAARAGAVTLTTLAVARGSAVKVPKGFRPASRVRVVMVEHQEQRRLDQVAMMRCGAGERVDTVDIFVSPDDDLLARGAPGWARPLQMIARFERCRPHALGLLVLASQRSSYRQLRRHRRMLLKREEQLDQQLAFSRKS